jgi:serine/threonine protein kinase
MTEPEWNTTADSDANRPSTEPDPFATGMGPSTEREPTEQMATPPVSGTPAPASDNVDPYATSAGVTEPPEAAAWPEEAREPIPHHVPGYELLSVLGQGGMGIVYKARHLRMKRLVAIKIIRSDCIVTQASIERFNKEIQAAGALSHPNVVMAHDADEVDGLLYFVMEYVEGIDLAKLVREKGPLPVETACDYVLQTALGLQHAHERGMVHRDIKPSNLLLTHADGLVKILDMGLARLQEPDQPASQLTGSGVVMGTPDFMSPEQSRDSRSADIRSDIYSLGCTFFFLLTGRVPFPEGSFTEKLLKHCMDEPTPVTTLRSEVPPEVFAVLRKMMAKRPDDRYQTPIELAQALTPFATQRPSATRSGTLVPDERWLAATDPSISPGSPLADRPKPQLVATAFSMPAVAGGKAVKTETDRTDVLAPVRERPASRHLLLLGMFLLAAVCGAGAIVAFTMFGPQATTTASVAIVDKPTSPLVVVTAPDTKTVPPTKPVVKVDVPPPPPPPPPPKPLTGVLVRFDKPMQAGTLRTALAPNGEWAVAGYDGRVYVWPVPGAKPDDRPSATLNTLFSPAALAVLGDGRRVAMIRQSDDPTTPAGKVPPVLWFVSYWVTSGPAQDRLLRGQKSAFTAAALSSRGNYVLTGGEDRSVRLWDLESRTEKLQVGTQDSIVSAVALSPDGRYAFSGDRGGRTMLWDLDNPKQPTTFKRHTNTVTCLTFSPDGRYALSAGYDKTICLYDVKKGEYMSSFTGHTETVRCLAFLPDNVHFLSGSEDTTIRLWTIEGREDLASYKDHNVGVLSVAASPDGKYAVFMCADSTIRRLALPEKLP